LGAASATLHRHACIIAYIHRWQTCVHTGDDGGDVGAVGGGLLGRGARAEAARPRRAGQVPQRGQHGEIQLPAVLMPYSTGTVAIAGEGERS
jgi:hypothetical protein